VHPLRRLHERLPVYRQTGGHAYVRSTRSHWSHSHSAIDADAPRAVAALRFVALRRLLRGLPVKINIPECCLSCAPSGQPGAPPVRSPSRPHVSRHENRKSAFQKAWRFHLAQRLGRIGARLFTQRDGWIHSLPSIGAKWTQTRDLRALSSQTSTNGGRREKGGKMSATVSTPGSTPGPASGQSRKRILDRVRSATHGSGHGFAEPATPMRLCPAPMSAVEPHR